jgi:septum formation protein
MSLILVTASTRAAALLRDAGFAFETVTLEVDSPMDVEETPDGYVRRLAVAGAAAAEDRAGGRPVVAAATIVTLDGQLMDAPGNVADAASRIRALAGRDHVVTTAVCLSFVADEARRRHTAAERTTVTLAPLTDDEIEWYAKSGEPIGAAGGYVMDGLASRYVTRIAGSPGNALGMPVAALYRLWVEAGLPPP